MTSGTINDSGALTATLTAGTAAISVGGNFAPAAFTAGSSTVTLSGTTAALGATTFDNLVITTTGSVTLTGRAGNKRDSAGQRKRSFGRWWKHSYGHRRDQRYRDGQHQWRNSHGGGKYRDNHGGGRRRDTGRRSGPDGGQRDFGEPDHEWDRDYQWDRGRDFVEFGHGQSKWNIDNGKLVTNSGGTIHVLTFTLTVPKS